MSRISEIVDYIGNPDVLLDVGCDHGYIGINTLQKTTCKVVFSDISKLSLAKAKSNLPAQYFDNAEFLVCDGIPSRDADCCVIAGLGGLSIIKMLKNITSKIKYFVLQPMKNIEKLREYLYSNYLVQIDDIIEEDGRYYTIIIVKNTFNKIDVDDKLKYFGLREGETISKNKIKFLQYKQNILQKSIAFTRQSVLQLKSMERFLLVSKELELLKEILKEKENV